MYPTAYPDKIRSMKRVLIFLALVIALGVVVFLWWRQSIQNEVHSDQIMEPPVQVGELTYPEDPEKLQQWLRETHYELIHNKEDRALRWEPLLKIYCSQGCVDCCGLFAYALQKLNRWEQARQVATEHSGADSPYSAFALARYYSHHLNDDLKALPLYKQACAKGLAISCTGAGVIHNLGRQVDKDHQKAIAFYRQACESGEPIACTNMGMLLESGAGVERDPRQAAELYRRSCQNTFQYTRGCINLGVLLIESDVIPKDDERALALFRTACRHRDGRGCYYLARLYESGRGIARDLPKAKELNNKACRLGYRTACAEASEPAK